MFGIHLPENFDRPLFIPEPDRVLAAVAYDPDAVVPGVYLFPRIHQPGGQEAFCGCWPPGREKGRRESAGLSGLPYSLVCDRDLHGASWNWVLWGLANCVFQLLSQELSGLS